MSSLDELVQFDEMQLDFKLDSYIAIQMALGPSEEDECLIRISDAESVLRAGKADWPSRHHRVRARKRARKEIAKMEARLGGLGQR